MSDLAIRSNSINRTPSDYRNKSALEIALVDRNERERHLRRRFAYGSALSFDAGDDQQVGEQEQRSFLTVHRLPGNDGHQVVSEECSVGSGQMYQPVDQRLDLFQLQVVLFGAVDFHRHFVHLLLRFDQRLVVRMRCFGVLQ